MSANPSTTSAPSLRPPFTQETAQQKVKTAQNLWNTQDPDKITKAYTEDSIWRNRSEFAQGHTEIHALLTRKWAAEKNYKLRKELFAFSENKIAVQFWYEYQHVSSPLTKPGSKDGLVEGRWYRCYGLEDWTFAEDGRMRKRQMSGNDLEIEGGEEGRWFKDGVDVN